jgi:hypothetical protein
MSKKQAGMPASRPWMPPLWELADARALQDLARGEAAPHQQQRALEYIVNTLAATYDLSYRPDSDRDTTFAEGRRFVGLQIVKLLKLNLENLKHE